MKRDELTWGVENQGKRVYLQVDGNDLVSVTDIDEDTGEGILTVHASTGPNAGLRWQGTVNVYEHLRVEYDVAPVTADDVTVVLGQFDPRDRWNGWLCPMIDAWSVQTILERTEADDPGGDYGFDWDWNEEGWLLLIERQYRADEPDTYEGEAIAPDEDGLYPLGTYSWTWHEASEGVI